jgi:hypothetical protein
MVPGAGLEPARCFHRGILNPLRLPISPPRHCVTLLDRAGSLDSKVADYSLKRERAGRALWYIAPACRHLTSTSIFPGN